MMVLLPDVHDDDDDEHNDGDDNDDDDDGFLHKKKKTQIAHLSIHKFRRISHNLRQVFVPIFLGYFPLSLCLSLSNDYLSHFPHIAILHGLSLINS